MPFQPNQVANPKGRPPDEFSFWAHVKRVSKQEDHKRIRAAAEKFLTLAANGEPWAVKEMFDRSDGKAVQAIEQKTTLEGAMEIYERPKLSPEEWMKLHAVGPATGAAK